MDIKPKDEDSAGFASSFFPFNNVYMDPNSSNLAELGGLLLENEEAVGFNYYEEPPPPTYMPIETSPAMGSTSIAGDTVRYASQRK